MLILNEMFNLQIKKSESRLLGSLPWTLSAVYFLPY